MKILYSIFTFSVLVFIVGPNARAESKPRYWDFSGPHAISWNVAADSKLPHADDLEMAGEKVAAIVEYSVDKERRLSVKRNLIFPQLRRFIRSSDPDWLHYRAYLKNSFGDEYLPVLVCENLILDTRIVDSVRIDGKLNFFHRPVMDIRVERAFYPSSTERQLVERWVLTNKGTSTRAIEVGHTRFTRQEKGFRGDYRLEVTCDAGDLITLEPGQSYSFGVYFRAYIDDEPEITENYASAGDARDRFIATMKENLVLKTPDPVLNTLFFFSKIRASESIYDTPMGLVHSPGGGNYYAGIWANDQVEYSGPFFPYLGYEKGNIAALNAYLHFQKNIPPGYAPIRSSFELSGDLECCSKDRGDAAMIAFGTTKFVLATGDRTIAESLWPMIEWSLEYCHRKRNPRGAVMSDTDEMEGRIPTGDANLSTSSLYYGGLVQAARLARSLGKDVAIARVYEQRAREMEEVIEHYFGATIEGIPTYRYYDGHETFRHWICLPLVMGIDTRAKGTTRALFEKLWTDDGVLVDPGDEVFWDRGTLYAFIGAFSAGAQDRALERLVPFSATRLLGARVPYVVEAYPEYNMRHLSAESALYARIFTEGMLGIEPLGFQSFAIRPQLPATWNEVSLEKCHVMGRELDFVVKRNRDKLDVLISQNGKVTWKGKLTANQRVEIKVK